MSPWWGTVPGGRLFWTDGHGCSQEEMLSRDLCSEGKSHTACESRRRETERAACRGPAAAGRVAWRETEQTQGAGEQRSWSGGVGSEGPGMQQKALKHRGDMAS